MSGFDLAALRTTSEEGAVMEVVDLQGKPVLNSDKEKITITLLSADSPAYKKVMRERQNELLNKKQRRGGNSLDMEVIENISKRMSIKAEQKGFELVFSVYSDVPTQIMGDSLRLSQVLLNLTNNAIKFTKKGFILVKI